MKIVDRPIRGEDLTGRRFGMWVVLGSPGVKVWESGNHQRMWQVKCDCGNVHLEQGGNLKAGKSKSCGCAIPAKIAQVKTTHGYTKNRKPHPMYRSWAMMLTRCRNVSIPGAHNYVGRGIKVCERWLKFENFLQDMGPTWMPGLSIERKDNNGNYEPENCCWADQLQQANNCRTNRRVHYNGEVLTVAQWSRRVGLGDSVIRYRLNHGWSVQDALMVPP